MRFAWLLSAAAALDVEIALSSNGVRNGHIRWELDDARTNNAAAVQELCTLWLYDATACDKLFDDLEAEGLRSAEKLAVSRISASTLGAGCGGGDKCKSLERKALFDSVYRSDFWLRNESASGTGSDEASVSKFVDVLSHVIAEYKITSLLDLGCGDGAVVRRANLTGVDYIGADVSQRLLDRHARDGTAEHLVRNGSKSAKFALVDAIVDALPTSIDLVMMRDVMGHTSPADNMRLLANIAKSRPKWLLLKTFLRNDANFQIDVPLALGIFTNLFKAPYCAPDPVAMWRDDIADSFMGLWQVSPKDGLATTAGGVETAWMDCDGGGAPGHT
ncbi:hypothetical protein M885DRAFT_535350 [Pelagophyceae sp. CCMP2097]|nr:hypothetical protein M885DRAFT_535350 [Pelagophyceae sp. CCMP2097]